MAANPVPKAASATNTQIDESTLNPDQTASASTGVRARQVVHCTLVFEGVSFVPDNLYDALDAQYATVAYEKDTAARGCYIFNIGPA